jgi:hypothetical protein
LFIYLGNAKLNLAFVANLFNRYPGLRADGPESLGDFDLGNTEETREERSLWLFFNTVAMLNKIPFQPSVIG